MGQADMQSGADVVALAEERQRRSEQTEASLSTAGGMLRAAREAMKLDLPTLAEKTNIREAHLEAIEAMAIDRLPSQPYTMGFVRAFAREVNLPEDALMDRFRQQAGYTVRDRAPGISAARTSPASDGGKGLSVLALLLVLGFVLWCAWQILVTAAPDEVDEATRFSFSAEDTADARPMNPEDTASVPGFVPPVTEPRTGEAEEAVRGAETPAPAGEATQPSAAPDTDVAAPAAETDTPAPSETVTAPAEEIVEDVVADVALRRLTAVEPVYPPLCEAQAQPIETVTVSYSVSARGRVANPRVAASTNTCFNGAALAALTRWRYDPATVTTANARQTNRFIFERPY
jgi:TonB family protein